MAGGDRPEMLVVPEAAIYQVRGRKVAFVAADQDRFQVRDVELGRNQDGGFEVISGLREGDRVATDGGVRLKAMLLNGAAAAGTQ